MANRQIGEDEVTGGGRTVQIGHTRGRDTGQNRRVGLALHAARGDLAVLLQAGVEEEAGIVVEGNLLAFIPGYTLLDPQLDNGRWVDGPPIAVGCGRV